MPGSDHGPSIKCPDIYEALRRQGYSKEKSARISNAACRKRGMKSSEGVIDVSPDEEDTINGLIAKAWVELYPGEALPEFLQEFAEAKCKNEGDSCFKKSDYAYTPSDVPGSWKIRLTNSPGGDPDAQIVGAAIAALGKGFRGNKADIPDDALPGVMERVRQAWREANPDKDDDDMPTAIAKKAAEFEEKRTPDYLGQMISWMKEKFGSFFDEDEFKAAHRAAMGHAGGKATARKRRAEKEKVAASEVYEHTLEHPEFVESCNFCMDYYSSPQPPVIKMIKADERVNYREASEEQELQGVRCYDCRFYEWGACRLVEGTIEADDLCDLFSPPVRQVPEPSPSLYAAADTGSAWRLFTELPKEFADVPDVVNVLPVPGVYDHKQYGKIVVTPDRNSRFVENFQNQVYQKDIPITINVEHDGKSGAMGYFKELRLNDDGSVDAVVEWNASGVELIEGDRFHYFSPEWFDEWRDPVTGNVFEDVLVGGALTVRPFFKESALRPLVASEMALYAPEGGSDAEPTIITLRPLVATEYRQESRSMGVELTEEEVKEFRELKQSRESDREAIRLANERADKLEGELRRKRFSDIVRGKAEGSDGAAWIGDVKSNVESLERLAHVFGEDSDEFKAEVAFRTELAKSSKEAGIFKSVGSPEGESSVGDGSASAEVDKRASELVTSGMKREDALSKIFREDPALYNKYRKETLARDE